MKPTNKVYCLFLKIQFGSIKTWRFGMVRNRGERPLLTAPKNEYNFIFYPTFEPNLRAITK